MMLLRREPLLRSLSPPPEPFIILFSSAAASSPRPPGRRPRPSNNKPPPPPDLRRLNSRIVDLTRRRQLAQIMEEVEAAKRRARGAWGLDTIVMNAVLEACVLCGDVDLFLRLFEDMRRPRGCGVDRVSYGILLKLALSVGTDEQATSLREAMMPKKAVTTSKRKRSTVAAAAEASAQGPVVEGPPPPWSRAASG